MPQRTRPLPGTFGRIGKPLRRKKTKPAQTALPEAFADRLADEGAARLLGEELSLRDVVQAMRHIRASMFAPVPPTGLSSMRSAELRSLRASLPPVVTLGHLHAVLPSPSRTERELAELVSRGVVRKLRVERRGALGEAVVEMADLEALVQRACAAAGLSPGAADVFLAALRQQPAAQELTAGVLAVAQADELVRAGFLTSATRATRATAPAGGRLDARPEDRTTLMSVHQAARSASGSLSAVGGPQALHLAGAGLGDRAAPMPAFGESSALRISLPGLGRYLKLADAAVGWLAEALGRRTRWGEAPEDWLRERFEAGGLYGARWKILSGVEWPWAVGLAAGLGTVELFDTGSVGKAIRALAAG